MELKIIAKYHGDFSQKFGIPRQSALADLKGEIVFEKDFCNPDFVRGIEQYSRLWIIWQFSESEGYSPTVRPPKLGGNERVGVFATRSPFRPNALGLTTVRLGGVRYEDGRLILDVSGADLLDGTPIFDIKPYIPYADCFPDAKGGFAEEHKNDTLAVIMPESVRVRFGDKAETLQRVLSLDPRPSYQDDPERVYGMEFAGQNIKFKVSGGVLTVLE